MDNTVTLSDLLQTLVTGEAEFQVACAFEALYPVSYDPATGVLVEADRN